jgi:hypothetical protein
MKPIGRLAAMMHAVAPGYRKARSLLNQPGAETLDQKAARDIDQIPTALGGVRHAPEHAVEHDQRQIDTKVQAEAQVFVACLLVELRFRHQARADGHRVLGLQAQQQGMRLAILEADGEGGRAVVHWPQRPIQRLAAMPFSDRAILAEVIQRHFVEQRVAQ